MKRKQLKRQYTNNRSVRICGQVVGVAFYLAVCVALYLAVGVAIYLDVGVALPPSRRGCLARLLKPDPIGFLLPKCFVGKGRKERGKIMGLTLRNREAKEGKEGRGKWGVG